jgi:MOSC domain-containing protein YiiM
MPGATIVQVNVSAGGVPKRPVAEAHIGALGLAGDDHDDKVDHGGPDRAVCLFAIERIEALIGEGHPIGPGTTGENITTRGLRWEAVVPGARLRLGPEALIEITGYAPPCKTNARWFTGGEFKRISHKVFPGWSRVYARVLVPGTVRPGDGVEIVE